MNLLPGKDDLKALSEDRGEYCISIYMPTARKGVETLQGSVRLKNLLREAEGKLTAHGAKPQEISGLLENVRTLVESYSFWQHQSDGLALFIRPGGEVRSFRIPIELDENVFVNNHFHLKPLMQVMTANGRFFMLALSQKRIRFFEGNRFSVIEVDLPEGTPRSLDEAMKYEDPERMHHFSPGSQGRSSGGIAEFAGHGLDASDMESMKNRMRRFFHDADKGIMQLIAADSAPLVLVGLEYMHPIYHDANNYSHLITDGGVIRTADDLRPEELHEFAWQVVEPIFRRDQDSALERYNALKNKGLASSDLHEVIPAAVDGRIESLIVPVGEQRWGTFEPESRRVELSQDETAAAGEDLIDLAAVRTFLNGGAVYAVDQQVLPEKDVVAAVFRY